MSFPRELYEYLETNTLIEVKGGRTRKTFLKIWMVNVDGRIFARSWNKSSKSWFTAFIETRVGQIRFDEQVIPVKGTKLYKDDPMNQQIDKAYLSKYNQDYNVKYAKGITQPEYADYTMEFFFDKADFME